MAPGASVLPAEEAFGLAIQQLYEASGPIGPDTDPFAVDDGRTCRLHGLPLDEEGHCAGGTAPVCTRIYYAHEAQDPPG